MVRNVKQRSIYISSIYSIYTFFCVDTIYSKSRRLYCLQMENWIFGIWKQNWSKIIYTNSNSRAEEWSTDTEWMRNNEQMVKKNVWVWGGGVPEKRDSRWFHYLQIWNVIFGAYFIRRKMSISVKTEHWMLSFLLRARGDWEKAMFISAHFCKWKIFCFISKGGKNILFSLL